MVDVKNHARRGELGLSKMDDESFYRMIEKVLRMSQDQRKKLYRLPRDCQPTPIERWLDSWG